MGKKTKKQTSEELEDLLQWKWSILRLRPDYRKHCDELKKQRKGKPLWSTMPEKKEGDAELDFWIHNALLPYEEESYKKAFEENIAEPCRRAGRSFPPRLYKDKLLGSRVSFFFPDSLRSPKLFKDHWYPLIGAFSFETILALEPLRFNFTANFKKDELKKAICEDIDWMHERINEIRQKLRIPERREKQAVVALRVYEKIKYKGVAPGAVAKEMAGKVGDLSNIRSRVSQMYKKAQKIVEPDSETQLMKELEMK